MNAPRSYLYVPGDSAHMLAKAASRGADTLVIDLEDSVRPQHKEQARATVRAWLDAPAAPGCGEIWLRVNPEPFAEADLELLASSAWRGICLPKVSDPAQLEALDRSLSTLEERLGILGGSLAVQPLIETAAGLLDAHHIARCPRVLRLQLGEVDLSAELGTMAGPDERELQDARSRVVLVAAAAGIQPVGPVSTDMGDAERFRASTQRLRRLGFRSRACIHPAQVEIANEVFTPTAGELEEAAAVLRVLGEGASESGTARGPHGQMIDEAVVRAARRLFEARDF